MQIIDKNIDDGKPFDWGNVSSDYAKFRDIYPSEFYQKIIDRNLCTKGQSVSEISQPVQFAPKKYKFRGKTPVPVPISKTLCPFIQRFLSIIF